MARETTKGLERGTYISISNDGSRRTRGTVIETKEFPQGTFVYYRDGKTGGQRLVALARVRVERADEKRRKQVRRATLTSEDVKKKQVA